MSVDRDPTEQTRTDEDEADESAPAKAKRPVAVMIADADGSVVAQNRTARKLIGRASGKKCWELVPEVRGAHDLPCDENCTTHRVEQGLQDATTSTVSLRGDQYELSCVPVDDKVVSTFVPLDGGEPPDDRLSPRERDALRLLAEGLTSADIAERMGIRESTVRVHVENMRKKLGVKTRAGLVAYGYKSGILKS